MTSVKFAHMGDCHIGAWRDQKLRYANSKAFVKAIDKCIEENVDFILITGDLFNTSLPPIDNLKTTVQKLRLLKEKNVPVYIIAGSHDFSPSGKTMIEVLEKAGLCINVTKGEVIDKKLKLNFTVDPKTNIKIAGMIGKKGMLEKKYYENLIRSNLEEETGFKIFMFHTALDELKPKELDKIRSCPMSLLPKHFNYYAGGHVHEILKTSEEEYGMITYPGPLFPNNFREVENIKHGGFFIVEVSDITQPNPIITLRHEKIKVYNICCIDVNCDDKTPPQIEELIKEQTKNNEFYNTIVTIRLQGTLESGKPYDINFKDIFSQLYLKGAFFVMKSTTLLKTKDFEEINIGDKTEGSIEDEIIESHSGQIKIEGVDGVLEKTLTKKLMWCLDKEKQEGETVKDFEARVTQDVEKVLESEIPQNN